MSSRWPVAAGLAAFVVVAGLYLFSGINRADEAWFLQVVTRVADGEALYGDVFFGATPLAVWLTWPLVALFGAQLAWVKLLVLASFAATLALAVWIVRRLGGGTPAALLVAAAFLVFATPYRGSLYQPLATTFLVACLAAALAWVDGGPRGQTAVALAGAAAGLAFATKQNVGLYALAALLGAAAVAGAGRRLASAGIALAAFLTCALLHLVPVAATGGFGKLVDYGFTNKGAYTELGGISYRLGLRHEARQTRRLLLNGDLLDAAVPAYHTLLYFLVPAILVLLVLAWGLWAGGERRRVEVVGLFAVASAAAIFPRADAVHLVVVAPVLLVAGWYALHLLLRSRPGPARAAAVCVALVLLPAVVALAAWPVRQADRGARLSSLPIARGVLLDRGQEARMKETATSLAQAGADGPLFLAMREAGLYYLLSGVRNPTPYDFPLASAFGRTGQKEVAARIRRGEITSVCLSLRRAKTLTPWQIGHAVRSTLAPGERTPVCRLYRAQ